MSERRAHNYGVRVRHMVRVRLLGGTEEYDTLEPWHETPRTIGEEKREPWPIWEPE